MNDTSQKDSVNIVNLLCHTDLLGDTSNATIVCGSKLGTVMMTNRAKCAGVTWSFVLSNYELLLIYNSPSNSLRNCVTKYHW